MFYFIKRDRACVAVASPHPLKSVWGRIQKEIFETSLLSKT